jgi:hypothetical protein
MRGMKTFLIALLLVFVAACSYPTQSRVRPQPLTSGVIESVEPVETANPAAPAPEETEDDDEDASALYGERVIVRLDDGRFVYVLYTGPRQFHAGQPVRVGVGEWGAFIL